MPMYVLHTLARAPVAKLLMILSRKNSILPAKNSTVIPIRESDADGEGELPFNLLDQLSCEKCTEDGRMEKSADTYSAMLGDNSCGA